MSEPFLERLSRFTPDAGGLDRDALLFAAGRGSARPNRGWKALAALLAGTQMLSLALLFQLPTPPAVGFREAVANVPVPPAVLEPTVSAIGEPGRVVGPPGPAGSGDRTPPGRRRGLHR